MGYEWPEVFKTAEVPEGIDPELALAHQLEGWALCMAGVVQIPTNFGLAMVRLAKITGVATPGECLAKAKASA